MSEQMLINRTLFLKLPTGSDRRLALLTGARQTGKTTLLKIKYPHLHYINLDAPENRELVRSISSFAWHQTIGNAVMDEAQKEPSLFEKVKYAFDDGKIQFTVLSGSAQILLLKTVREVLSGRIFVFELFPLMLCELAASPAPDPVPVPLLDRLLGETDVDLLLSTVPPRLPAEQEDRLRSFEQYLLTWGGMPGLLGLSDADRLQWLRSYEYTYLERDLADLARLSDLEPFKKFQRLSALRSGQLLSYSELGRDAGISADTARRYLEYLRLSYQSILLPPFSRNLTSQVIKTPKIYWLDAGLWRQLTGFRGDVTGALYETHVVAEIHKWIRSVGREVELTFYRTRSGMELDLLIQTPHGIIGAEIKGRETVENSDLYAMREVAKALGKSWLGGFCIYRGQEIRRLGDPALWSIPSFRLFSS
jgi:uncharacterized protein